MCRSLTRTVPSQWGISCECLVGLQFPLADSACRDRTVTLPELQSKLGDDSGTWLWEIIRGLDYSEGESSAAERFTVLTSVIPSS